jgi:hypothetical protein
VPGRITEYVLTRDVISAIRIRKIIGFSPGETFVDRSPTDHRNDHERGI